MCVLLCVLLCCPNNKFAQISSKAIKLTILHIFDVHRNTRSRSALALISLTKLVWNSSNINLLKIYNLIWREIEIKNRKLLPSVLPWFSMDLDKSKAQNDFSKGAFLWRNFRETWTPNRLWSEFPLSLSQNPKTPYFLLSLFIFFLSFFFFFSSFTLGAHQDF